MAPGAESAATSLASDSNIDESTRRCGRMKRFAGASDQELFGRVTPVSIRPADQRVRLSEVTARSRSGIKLLHHRRGEEGEGGRGGEMNANKLEVEILDVGGGGRRRKDY